MNLSCERHKEWESKAILERDKEQTYDASVCDCRAYVSGAMFLFPWAILTNPRDPDTLSLSLPNNALAA